MADEFGETTFPVPAPSLDAAEAAADPLLTLLGAFLKAAINAACETAWATIYPGELPVSTVRFQDPNEGVFDERDLPALFLWRPTRSIERITDDWLDDKSEVVALWVPPPSTLDRQSERAPFANVALKSMARALTEGHDPAWVLDGDATSLLPDVFGSDLTLQASLHRLVSGVRATTTPITIEMADGSAPKRYVGARATFNTEELLERDASAWPGAYPAAMHVDVKNEEGAVRVERVFAEGYAEGELDSVDATPPAATATTP